MRGSLARRFYNERRVVVAPFVLRVSLYVSLACFTLSFFAISPCELQRAFCKYKDVMQFHFQLFYLYPQQVDALRFRPVRPARSPMRARAAAVSDDA